MSDGVDPVAAWTEVSGAAARATGYRPAGVPAPARRWSGAASIVAMTVALAVIVTGLALRSPATPTGSGPVASSVDDGMFRLALTTPRGTYEPGAAIEPVAEVTYLGPDPAISVQHSASELGFRIDEVGGGRRMDAVEFQSCNSTNLVKGMRSTVPFTKSGSPTDDPAKGFDLAWYHDRTLTLPVGTWRITVTMRFAVGGCAGGEHVLSTSNEIRVVAPTGDGPVVDRADDGVFRLELSVPRRTYTPSDAIEPVATVTYLGPDAAIGIHHGGQIVGWEIAEVGGGRAMNGGMTAVCAADSIRRDTPLSFPFEKSGAIGPSFDAVWFGDPVLHLPAGTWRIKAYTTISTDDGPPPSDGSFACGTRDHGQEASTVITVSGDPDILPSAPPSANPTAEVSPSPSAAAPDRPIVSPSPGPVSGSVTDGSFRLDLTTPTGIYAENEMIMPVATLTYVGPDPTVTIEYGEPYVTFAVEEIGGVGRLAGSGSEVGSTATLARGVPTKIPFALALDQAWLADPVLKLPPGLWRITATFSAVIPGLGAFPIGSHRVSVENVIAVVGASKDGPAPSPSGPPDLQVAGALVAKFEDALSSGHADSVWTWLSPWSQHAAGSLAQFEQQYTRPAGAPAVEIGQPTQDPAMLTEAFLGARAADIAARADPAGTFVVSVRDPGIDGAAAATTNLVVARTVDGTWLIWLDVPVG